MNYDLDIEFRVLKHGVREYNIWNLIYELNIWGLELG